MSINDELSFMEYAERTVYEMQRLFRTKPVLECYAVIEMSSKMEELIYSQALKEYGLNKSGDSVWSKPEAVLWYQNKCERVLKNLDYRECNWRKCFDDNDANHMLQQLTKDDDKVKLVKKRKVENNVIRQKQRPKGNKSNIIASNQQLNINSSTESVSNFNNNSNIPFLPVPSFFGLNNENDAKVLSNDVLDYSNIVYPLTGDDYDLGFNFDDDSNLPDLKTNDWQNLDNESLQQQRERERDQRREQTVEIDNNMIDLIMDI